MKYKLALLCALGLVGATNASACYTVYGPANRVLYQGEEAPVDMSLPLREALAQRFAGAPHMVFDQGDCRSPGLVAAARANRTGDVRDIPQNAIRSERTGQVVALNAPRSGGGSSPLLTDRATAERLNVPHTVVAGDVVVVPPSAAERVTRPTLTVIPSLPETAIAAAGIPDTRTLGAGPVPARRTQTVITELRDPPVTIIERGQTAAIRSNQR